MEEITNFYLDKYIHENCFNKSKPYYSYIFFPSNIFKDALKIRTTSKRLIQVDCLLYFWGFFLKISPPILIIYRVVLFWFLEDASEVALCRHSSKWVFLKLLRNSYESTYAGVFSQISCRPLAWNFISVTAPRIFFKELYKNFFYRTCPGDWFWYLKNLAFKLLILNKFVSKQHCRHAVFDG